MANPNAANVSYSQAHATPNTHYGQLTDPHGKMRDGEDQAFLLAATKLFIMLHFHILTSPYVRLLHSCKPN